MSKHVESDRRRFIRNAGLGLVSAGVLAHTPWSRAQETAEKEESKEAKIKEFRTLGRTGFKVSDVSTGGPMDAGLLKALLDAGVNYIDTAESYGRGASEKVVGEVLKERDRKSLFITSKLVLKDEDTKETILDRSRQCFERLGTEYLDCMMIHSAPTVAVLKNEGFHEAMDQLKADGKLRFVGVSNHGSQWEQQSETMEQVLLGAAEDGRFDVMLLVYNFIQEEQGRKVLAACREKNIGTTLMKTNPVGGYLGLKQMIEQREKEGQEIPQQYKDILAKLKELADQADEFIKKNDLKNPAEIRDAAIRYVLSNRDVNSVCVSFRNFDDVENYVKLSGTSLSASEEKKLSAYRQGCGVLYCRHACGACEASCPRGVPVNTIMRYNHYFEAQGREKYAMTKYAALPTTKGDACQDCHGNCEASCPYGVPVQGLLSLAHHRLTLV
jgi:predicted aldo/keto reductase-like oxidoreductase